MCLSELSKIRVKIWFNLEKLFSNPLSHQIEWLVEANFQILLFFLPVSNPPQPKLNGAKA